MASYSRYELDSMRRQLDEQINRYVDAYNKRYPGDMVAPPIEYADLQSKIAEYYRECREIDKWAQELFEEAKETGWSTPLRWTTM